MLPKEDRERRQTAASRQSLLPLQVSLRSGRQPSGAGSFVDREGLAVRTSTHKRRQDTPRKYPKETIQEIDLPQVSENQKGRIQEGMDKIMFCLISMLFRIYNIYIR